MSNLNAIFTLMVDNEFGALTRITALIRLAFSTRFTGCIKQRTGLIAPVKIYEGEDEMLALALGGLRVLRGVEKPAEY